MEVLKLSYPPLCCEDLSLTTLNYPD
jgi:hypothetical protein